MPALFCKTMFVSWALIFSEPHDLDGMEKHAAHCFITQEHCDQAAIGANAALYYAGSPGSVACVRQPPADNLKGKDAERSCTDLCKSAGYGEFNSTDKKAFQGCVRHNQCPPVESHQP